ncbi:MAG: Lipid A export ATP-binding/permease protein MsbA [Planctomycetes bacterium ADurb.Bin126]|nr:MAG: Lipid A export ATP-binding/permease protein MsbA [Planctomycetes bacterium ADurb.Bin126]HOD83956.1 ATP-binding cassette domain-containing protein [Phycisphaerae bacterium]HQL75586.1 ATP-binding cassette domain-containing protein [Phycisphaerae bacterium]
MRPFARSLRYLRRRTGWIAVMVTCAVLISALWAAGLAVLLPGAKVLLSEEGLHGWVYRRAAQSKLGATLQRRSGGEQGASGLANARWLEVTAVRESSPAARSGLGPGDRLAAREDIEPTADLARCLARTPGGTKVAAWLLRPAQAPKAIELTLDEPALETRVLLWAASWTTEPASYTQRYPLLLMLLGVAAALAAARMALEVVKDFLAARLVLRTALAMRMDALRACLDLPSTTFSREGTAQAMGRFQQDIGEIAAGQMTLLGGLLSEPARALGALAVAMALSWRLTLLAVLVGPPIYLLVRRVGRFTRRSSRRSLEIWAEMMGMLKETLSASRIVKLYRAQTDRRRRFLRLGRRLLEHQSRLALAEALVRPAVELLGLGVILLVVAAAGYMLLQDGAAQDSERLIALTGCLVILFASAQRVATLANRLSRVDAAAERFEELLAAPGEEPAAPLPALPACTSSLEFRRICYRYPGGDHDVLREVSFTLRPGDTLALVGPNGAGKTTLVSLVAGLLRPTSGSIFIDAHDIERHSLRSLRRQVAMVSQDDVVFNASVADNIAMGLRGCDRGRIEQAAAAAFADEFIRLLPRGYDTVLSEGGQMLSGGQRQRLTIARAILREPRILIFDEALSQIDSESESKIQLAMERFMRGRTTLVVAHRFSTVRLASRILVLDEGRMAGLGTHEELMETCEAYRRLYQAQFIAAPESVKGSGRFARPS